MYSARKSGLFLIEMIIAIAFFAVASAVCMQIFVRAHLTSENTRRLNMAMNAAQNAAECFKAADASVTGTAVLLDGRIDGNKVAISFDEDWRQIPLGEGNARFALEVTVHPEQAPVTAGIQVIDLETGRTPVYTLEVKKYVP